MWIPTVQHSTFQEMAAASKWLKEREVLWGSHFQSFFLFHFLTSIYLVDNCLSIRVSSISVHSIPTTRKVPSWQNGPIPSKYLCEITLPQFSKFKANNTRFYTPPFYTNERGYKLHMLMYSNGHDSGKDTHISAAAFLMEGDFDDCLQWPFLNDISFELVNWREDQNHHTDAISFGLAYTSTCGLV